MTDKKTKSPERREGDREGAKRGGKQERVREDCRKAAVSELQGDAELAAAVLGQPEKGGGEKERERETLREEEEEENSTVRYLSSTMTLC